MSVPLILSGNEITARVRALAATLGTSSSGQMEDGRDSSDPSLGIRRAATNLHPRGQCDSTGAGQNWNIAAGTTGTVTLDTAVAGKFTPNSARIDANGSAVASLVARTNTGLAIAAGTSIVGSIYFKGAAGQSYHARMRIQNTDATTDNGAFGATFVADGTVQLIGGLGVADIPAFAVQTGKTGDAIRIEVAQLAATAESFWGSCAMIEKAQSVVAPYVATSGGATATHGAARVNAPTSLMNTTQGWMAMRVRMGVASASMLASSFCALNDGTLNNRLALVFSTSWQTRRISGGAGGSSASVADSWNAGDMRTVILRWDAARIYISIGGAAFVSAANGNTFTPTTFEIGAETGVASVPFNGDVLWFACGTGTLTDADAAKIAPLWDTTTTQRPLMPWDFPPNSGCTGVYNPGSDRNNMVGGAPGPGRFITGIF